MNEPYVGLSEISNNMHNHVILILVQRLRSKEVLGGTGVMIVLI